VKKLIIIILIVPTLSFIQTKELKIEWSTQRKLTWEDFKGKINPASEMVAMSDCGISSKMKAEKDTLSFLVESYFIPHNSWIKEKKENTKLLNHEQGHFDINEIIARKFRMELAKTPLKKTTVNVIFRDLQKKYFSLLDKEQGLYDIETNHSKNYNKQLEWDNKIEKELKLLEEYSTTILKCTYTK
jgi:hypothetical protein